MGGLTIGGAVLGIVKSVVLSPTFYRSTRIQEHTSYFPPSGAPQNIISILPVSFVFISKLLILNSSGAGHGKGGAMGFSPPSATNPAQGSKYPFQS